ncbi:MAG: cupin domain-containing protein [Burkholderiaceae bacterium]|nr:cupin domain-containing protein [Burkholderiaceae bacterium]
MSEAPQASKAPRVRRVVTGHDAQGKAIVKIDEVCTDFVEGRPNGFVRNIWTTDTAPADNSGQQDGGNRAGRFTMIENGTVFRILHFMPGLAQRVHRTDSIDYLIVMSGEIDMELDDGVSVHLNEGDVMVQRGTVHNWVNKGSQPCTMAVILVHAKPVEAGGQTLQAFG